jgi:transposase InsO family protein
LTTLFSGHIKDNLLFVSAKKPAAFITSKKDVGATLWHHRLGHPGDQVLQKLQLPRPTSDDCKVCQCSKMTLLPFSSHFSPALFPLHRLHLDLVGPVNPSLVSGFRYFLTFIDQFSSFKFVQFLKKKDDALPEFKKLVAMMENSKNSCVKEIVLDRGGEFVNHSFKAFTSERGILHIMSPLYTPEHNGFAERANRTIIEKTRCILMASNLPCTYWAKAVNTATFISNLLPTASRDNVSPWELWTKSPAPISHLKTFGCLAYIAVRKTHHSWKFGNTGKMGIFMGYENDGTTYRILRLSNMTPVPT